MKPGTVGQLANGAHAMGRDSQDICETRALSRWAVM